MKATKGVPKASRAPRAQQGRSLSDLKRLRDQAQALHVRDSQAMATKRPKTAGAQTSKPKTRRPSDPTIATPPDADDDAHEPPAALAGDDLHGSPATLAGDDVHEAPAALAGADRALFRLAMRFVRPLHKATIRAPGPARMAPDEWLQARRHHAEGAQTAIQVPPAPLPARSDSAASPTPYPAGRAQKRHGQTDDDTRQFLCPGCGPDLLRDLRRGKWPIQATLDLHGSTLDQARERMDRFLQSCLDHDIRCVRIVHGKGHGSRTGVAVLKDAVRTDLGRIAAVQAWVECNEREGGAGAIMALLRPETPQSNHKGTPP